MKRNSWIWTLTALLSVVFFAMCAAIAYATDADVQYAQESRESLSEEAETREGISESASGLERSTVFVIIGALGAAMLALTMAIFSVLNKNKKERLYKDQNASLVAF